MFFHLQGSVFDKLSISAATEQTVQDTSLGLYILLIKGLRTQDFPRCYFWICQVLQEDFKIIHSDK